MNSSTKDFLQRLEQTDWFASCATPLEPTEEVAPVDTWASALEICATQASDDARLEGSNELTVYLFKHDNAGLNQWNSKSAELKPRVLRLIHEKLATAATKGRIPVEPGKTFRSALEWDVLVLCMAHEYGDVVRTRYHELLEHWYLAGRFPCGWIGEVPDDMEGAFQMGKLAVL